MTDADALTPNKRRKLASDAALKRLLVESFSVKPQYTEDTLEDLQFTESDSQAAELSMLKGDLGQPVDNEEGLKMFELPQRVEDSVFGLRLRASRLYVERDCYPLLFDRIMQIWKESDQKEYCDEKDENLVVTGNAGTGKSWFQVYFVRRLLREYDENESRFRFVLRQYNISSFQFIDLKTGQFWEVSSDAVVLNTLRDLLTYVTNVLYMFEPYQDTTTAPAIFHKTPSLSSLPPNPTRLKEYEKLARPVFLFMPLWSLAHLAAVVRHEKRIDEATLEERYLTFGGIIRRTLEYGQRQLKTHKEQLDKRILVVNPDVITSMHCGLDDNSNAQLNNNISGFIAAYTDIPQTGNEAFTENDLTMTSKYVCDKVREKLRLASPREHLQQLAKCLNKEARDISGIDLEVSSAHLVSSGPQTVKWEYYPVGGPLNRPAATNLGLRKLEISRDETITHSKLNYPTDFSFGLVDFFVFINGQCWAFQTTWQDSHAFNLLTLLSFRKKIGADETQQVNLVFVPPPEKLDTYRRRPKLGYLVKGEKLGQPILRARQQVLGAPAAQTMWDNTNICVACPANNDWHTAIEKWLVKSP